MDPYTEIEAVRNACIHTRKDPVCMFRKKEDVIYLKFRGFSDFEDMLVHGFSTRLGGVSEGYYASMNLSYTRGDAEDKVRQNHERFAHAVGYDASRLVFSNQVHKTDIYKVTATDCGKRPSIGDRILEIDGLVTNEPGIPLITFYADCVPLLFLDPVERVIGMAHSGWKGTVGRIGEKMVLYMKSEYNCKPDNIRCVIAPSICQSCYEVSEDVAVQFETVFGNYLDRTLLYQKENGKYQLNLHRACEITLLEAGIRRNHLDITDLCTCCNPEIFYSHRASGGKRGNLAAVMMLRA